MKFAFAALVSVLTFAVHVSTAVVSSREYAVIEARAGPPQLCADPRHAVPLYRTWSASGSDHFYTTSAEEHQNAFTNLGYADEGIAGYIFPTQELHTVPLYRSYNGAISDHFYTINAAEADNAWRNLGYVNEGIAGYIYADAQCGGVNLYRMYSNGGSDHFYTTSLSEHDNAAGNGWSPEGTAGLILPY
ncbi:hypothetical protein B0H34DRAFT_795455 [Crassisporium funariophilum]|nr:hypothetical protein B0H34DRAFT_795455 [Crassisporium funariophilum]